MAATVLVATGCGGGERQDATGGDRAKGPYVIDLQRARFPARQRIAQRSTLVIAVRNAGETTIPNLAITLHGFTRRRSSSRDANPSVSLWTIDRPPPGASSAIEDTWTAGALEPGKRATLRWQVTAIAAGTHTLHYSIAPSLQGSAHVRQAGGGALRGTVIVKVDAEPALARVDPRSGRVIREK